MRVWPPSPRPNNVVVSRANARGASRPCMPAPRRRDAGRAAAVHLRIFVRILSCACWPATPWSRPPCCSIRGDHGSVRLFVSIGPRAPPCCSLAEPAAAPAARACAPGAQAGRLQLTRRAGAGTSAAPLCSCSRFSVIYAPYYEASQAYKGLQCDGMHFSPRYYSDVCRGYTVLTDLVVHQALAQVCYGVSATITAPSSNEHHGNAASL